MPAKSKAQQRFMGMVLSAKRGEKPASARVAEAAGSMSERSAEEFASTKTKGLPEKVKINPKEKYKKMLKGRV